MKIVKGEVALKVQWQSTVESTASSSFLHPIMHFPYSDKSLETFKFVSQRLHKMFNPDLFNTYSIKQRDLYYSETIEMTSQAESNFVWRTRATGEYSLRTLIGLVTSFFGFKNSIDQAVS